MARQYAVFNIDGTIVRSTLLQLTVKELVNRGRLNGAIAVDIDRLLQTAREQSERDFHQIYTQKALDMLISYSIDGKLKLADYQEAVDAVAISILSNTFVYPRQLIDSLKKNAYYLIAISGSERRAVEVIASKLGFDSCASGAMYKDDGNYVTGEIQRYTAKKTDVLHSIVQEHGLRTAGSLAISDNDNDLELLQMADQAIAFNPNRALFAAAKSKGYMVVIEEKDVVYGLQSQNGTYTLTSVNV